MIRTVRQRFPGLSVLLAAMTIGVGGMVACALPPATAGAAPPFRVVVISDMNNEYGSTDYRPEVGAAIALIRERWRPDLVLAAGDMIAGQRPALTDDNVRAMWAAFDSVVAAPLRAARIPFGFTVGNHDASRYPAHQRDRAFATEHWRNRERHPGVTFVDSTHFPIYYSFRQGPLFVVAWDASSAETLADTSMMRWLADQFAGDAARSAAFRVVLGHLPLYGIAEGRNRAGEVLAEADSLRRILERSGVHMYISGHHHAFYPGWRGDIELLHAGALGDRPRPLLGASEAAPRTATVLEFNAAAGSISLATYLLAGVEAASAVSASPDTVRTADLPRRLDGFNGWVVRRDLR